MKVVNVHEAKTTLSQLLAEVEKGGEVVIARGGKPVAKLSAVTPVLSREKESWRSHPGWENFAYDPAILAPMTDKECDTEGWP